jgi:hypothetical protein
MHTFSEKQMKRCHDAHNDKIISIQLHTVWPAIDGHTYSSRVITRDFKAI